MRTALTRSMHTHTAHMMRVVFFYVYNMCYACMCYLCNWYDPDPNSQKSIFIQIKKNTRNEENNRIRFSSAHTITHKKQISQYDNVFYIFASFNLPSLSCLLFFLLSSFFRCCCRCYHNHKQQDEQTITEYYPCIMGVVGQLNAICIVVAYRYFHEIVVKGGTSFRVVLAVAWCTHTHTHPRYTIKRSMK